MQSEAEPNLTQSPAPDTAGQGGGLPGPGASSRHQAVKLYKYPPSGGCPPMPLSMGQSRARSMGRSMMILALPCWRCPTTAEPRTTPTISTCAPCPSIVIHCTYTDHLHAQVDPPMPPTMIATYCQHSNIDSQQETGANVLHNTRHAPLPKQLVHWLSASQTRAQRHAQLQHVLPQPASPTQPCVPSHVSTDRGLPSLSPMNTSLGATLSQEHC